MQRINTVLDRMELILTYFREDGVVINGGVPGDVSLWCTMMLEFFARYLLRNASGIAKAFNRDKVRPSELLDAIKGDEQLEKVFSDMSIKGFLIVCV